MSTVTTAEYMCHTNLQDKTQIEEEQYIVPIEKQIFSLPIVKELRNDSSYEESRGYEHITEEQLEHHFTAGTLSGKGKVTVRPLIFFSEEKKESITILHIGDHMCGHSGIVHGI
jgi:hypothetical protein